MTTEVLEAASNRHSIKPDISADVAYSIARSQQATEEFKIFAIITTRIGAPTSQSGIFGRASADALGP